LTPDSRSGRKKRAHATRRENGGSDLGWRRVTTTRKKKKETTKDSRRRRDVQFGISGTKSNEADDADDDEKREGDGDKEF
jgi:hypothetical protein